MALFCCFNHCFSSKQFFNLHHFQKHEQFVNLLNKRFSSRRERKSTNCLLFELYWPLICHSFQVFHKQLLNHCVSCTCYYLKCLFYCHILKFLTFNIVLLLFKIDFYSKKSTFLVSLLSL